MEQRKYPRFPINCTVTCTSDAAKGEGRVLNLSLSGGAIESEVASLSRRVSEAPDQTA